MLHDPRDFPFTAALEAACADVRAEYDALRDEELEPSPDSLTTVRDGYDETGWCSYELFGAEGDPARRARCPRTAAACAAVPGLVHAGFSVFAPGTRLYPHRGELEGVLRCHLGLCVPEGDVALSIDGRTVRWREGRCLVFDDTHEHEAWNRAEEERVVLIATFRAAAARGDGGSCR